MPRLRALTSWSGRQAGEVFEASESDARVLCARDGIGGQRAERINDRALEPSKQPAELEPPAPKQTEKRRYMRRDLRAQN